MKPWLPTPRNAGKGVFLAVGLKLACSRRELEKNALTVGTAILAGAPLLVPLVVGAPLLVPLEGAPRFVEGAPIFVLVGAPRFIKGAPLLVLVGAPLLDVVGAPLLVPLVGAPRFVVGAPLFVVGAPLFVGAPLLLPDPLFKRWKPGKQKHWVDTRILLAGH